MERSDRPAVEPAGAASEVWHMGGMERSDKAAEPSMDEILASIRKIIAEEPAGTRRDAEPRSYGAPPQAPQPAPAKGAARPGQAGWPPPGTSQPPPGPHAVGTEPKLPVPERRVFKTVNAVNDDLSGIVDDPAPSAGPPISPLQHGSGRPAWRFGRTAGGAPPPVESATEGGGRPVSSLSDSLDFVRMPLRPSVVARGGEGAVKRPADAAPAAEAPSGTPREVQAPPEPKAGTGALSDTEDFKALLLRSFDPEAKSKAPEPHGEPKAEPAAVVENAGKRTAAPAASPAPVQPAPASKADAQSTAGASFGALKAGLAGAVRNEPEPADEQETTAAARSALGALAAGLAGATVLVPEATLPPVQAPLPAQTPAPAQAATPASAAATASAPVAMTASAPVAMTAPVSAPIEAAAQPPEPLVRTLEDTVAELLRPMLRQWLDHNMPRIVEKALRVELAEGLQAGKSKPGP